MPAGLIGFVLGVAAGAALAWYLGYLDAPLVPAPPDGRALEALVLPLGLGLLGWGIALRPSAPGEDRADEGPPLGGS